MELVQARRPYLPRAGAVAALMVLLAALLAGYTLNAPDAKAAGTLRVVCADWFYTNANQLHVEVHVEDGNGNGVVGAQVRVENSVDPNGPAAPYIYQTYGPTPTYTGGGVAQGAGCANPSTTTTRDMCQGLSGKNATPAGFYSTRIISVVPPAGSGLVWDGVTPTNGRFMSRGGGTNVLALHNHP